MLNRSLKISFSPSQIKTTSPEKFRVKPSVGVLVGSEQKKILVTLIDSVQPATLVRDKFLVVATPTVLPADAIPENDVFKVTNLSGFQKRMFLCPFL